MKLGRIEHRKLRTRRGEAVILFAVGPYRFAIAAQAVEEIRSGAAGLRSFTHGFAHVAAVRQTLEREGRSYFVVDTAAHLQLLGSRVSRLLLLRELPIAMTADSIDRMAEIAVLHPLPRAFAGEERNWYRGLALIGEEIIPVLEPRALLDRAQLAALSAALPATRAAQAATV